MVEDAVQILIWRHSPWDTIGHDAIATIVSWNERIKYSSSWPWNARWWLNDVLCRFHILCISTVQRKWIVIQINWTLQNTRDENRTDHEFYHRQSGRFSSFPIDSFINFFSVARFTASWDWLKTREKSVVDLFFEAVRNCAIENKSAWKTLASVLFKIAKQLALLSRYISFFLLFNFSSLVWIAARWSQVDERETMDIRSGQFCWSVFITRKPFNPFPLINVTFCSRCSCPLFGSFAIHATRTDRKCRVHFSFKSFFFFLFCFVLRWMKTHKRAPKSKRWRQTIFRIC